MLHAIANHSVSIALIFAASGVLFGLLICAYARVLVKLKAHRTGMFRTPFSYELVWTLVSISVLASILIMGLGLKILELHIPKDANVFLQLSPVLSVVTAVLSILVMTRIFPRPEGNQRDPARTI
jgi:hypothetical protein